MQLNKIKMPPIKKYLFHISSKILFFIFRKLNTDAIRIKNDPKIKAEGNKKTPRKNIK